MPYHSLWIQCSKQDVQCVKRQLEAAGWLSKEEKVRAGAVEGGSGH
jgi:hypothetical protein